MTSPASPIKDSPADEATPLLAASATGPTAPPSEDQLTVNTSSSAANKNYDDAPLPRTQIFLLCYARLVEPTAFFCIFPFVNQMIWETGNIEEADVGFYSGLIESLFSLTQMLLMILWGRAADQIGRKPILVFSLAGTAIATSLFGLSKTVWQMILFRCLAGAFAGTVVTVRAMITENSTPKTQARAFSFFAFTGNLGIFIGPLIGGVLSDPAGQYPSVFGGSQFFKDFPYALPTFATGLIGLSASIISAVFIKETLHFKSGNSSSPEVLMSTWEIIKAPGVAIVMYLYGHIMLLAIAFTAVLPVFWFTDTKLGGFGFSPLQISIFLGAIGISQALWILLAFPPLQRRFGTGGVMRGCAVGWPIMFISLPISNFFLRQNWKTAFWILAPVGSIGGAGVSMAFTCAQLALNDISPSASTLGTVNAMALTLTSGLRAVSPAFFTSIFAAGARTQFFYGYLIWVVLVALAVGLIFGLQLLPAKAEGKLKATLDEDEA